MTGPGQFCLLYFALFTFWVVFSLCIFLYCFVCQYQSSDWLWSPNPESLWFCMLFIFAPFCDLKAYKNKQYILIRHWTWKCLPSHYIYVNVIVASGGLLHFYHKCWILIMSSIYTVSGKKRPPKHVKITLWIENDSHYFSLYHEKPSICNVCMKFHDN